MLHILVLCADDSGLWLVMCRFLPAIPEFWGKTGLEGVPFFRGNLIKQQLLKHKKQGRRSAVWNVSPVQWVKNASATGCLDLYRMRKLMPAPLQMRIPRLPRVCGFALRPPRLPLMWRVPFGSTVLKAPSDEGAGATQSRLRERFHCTYPPASILGSPSGEVELQTTRGAA